MSEAIEQLLATGYEARRGARLKDAHRLFTMAAEEARGTNSPEGMCLLARSLAGVGQIERDEQQLSLALGHYQEAAVLYRHLGDPAPLAHTIRHLGDIQMELGSPTLARPWLAEALAIYRGLPHTSAGELANALRSWALCQEAIGGRPEAAAAWREAHSLYMAAGIQAGEAESARRLASLGDGEPSPD